MMPSTRVIKTKPIEARIEKVDSKKTTNEASPVNQNKGGLRKKRASSCPRCNHGNTRESVKIDGRNPAPKCDKKARGSVTFPPKLQTDVSAQRDRRMPNVQSKAMYEIQSHNAFTVIAPNPKKRRDIQRKAEEELAALEDLRLSKAMGYISISPSTVGGCLTLEEVRNKQQQEMVLRQRQKKVKKYILETSSCVK